MQPGFLISLGIGAPADILHFIPFGLDIGTAGGFNPAWAKNNNKVIGIVGNDD